MNKDIAQTMDLLPPVGAERVYGVPGKKRKHWYSLTPDQRKANKKARKKRWEAENREHLNAKAREKRKKKNPNLRKSTNLSGLTPEQKLEHRRKLAAEYRSRPENKAHKAEYQRQWEAKKRSERIAAGWVPRIKLSPEEALARRSASARRARAIAKASDRESYLKAEAEKQKKYRAKHPQLWKIVHQKSLIKRKNEAVQLLGGKCENCGVVFDINYWANVGKDLYKRGDPKFPEFHHRNHDGQEHRKTVRGTAKLRWWIKQNPEEAKKRIQLLCGKCHVEADTAYIRAKLKAAKEQECSQQSNIPISKPSERQPSVQLPPSDSQTQQKTSNPSCG